jgi:enoyl-CoA hydratase/carnithine racemase
MTATEQNSPVTVTRRADVVCLTLQRPERRNAISRAVADSLVDRVGEAVASGARVLILTGSGPVFCAGGDLDDLAQVIGLGTSQVAATVYGRFQRAILALGNCPVPVIAAINGPAVGAGLDLALGCHLRIASQDAWLSSAWIKLGLLTGMGGTRQLSWLVGPGRAAELTLTGRRIGAEEALAWGLVNRLSPTERVLDEAWSLAAEIAQHPDEAIRETLASLRRADTATLRDELATIAAVQARLLTGEEFRGIIASGQAGADKASR